MGAESKPCYSMVLSFSLIATKLGVPYYCKWFLSNHSTKMGCTDCTKMCTTSTPLIVSRASPYCLTRLGYGQVSREKQSSSFHFLSSAGTLFCFGTWMRQPASLRKTFGLSALQRIKKMLAMINVTLKRDAMYGNAEAGVCCCWKQNGHFT